VTKQATATKPATAKKAGDGRKAGGRTTNPATATITTTMKMTASGLVQAVSVSFYFLLSEMELPRIRFPPFPHIHRNSFIEIGSKGYLVPTWLKKLEFRFRNGIPKSKQALGTF
jgi:hypothetical protein